MLIAPQIPQPGQRPAGAPRTPGSGAGTPPTPPPPPTPAPQFNHPLGQYIPDVNPNHAINQYLVPEIGPGSTPPAPPSAPPAAPTPPGGNQMMMPNMPAVPPGWLPPQSGQNPLQGWDIQGDILRRPGGGGNPDTPELLPLPPPPLPLRPTGGALGGGGAPRPSGGGIQPGGGQRYDHGGIPADGGRSAMDALMDPSPYNNAVDRGNQMIGSIPRDASPLLSSSPAFGNLSGNLLKSLGGQWDARGKDMQNQAGLEFSRMAGTKVPQMQLSQMLGLMGLENDWLDLQNDAYRNDVLRSTGGLDSIMQLMGALGGFF